MLKKEKLGKLNREIRNCKKCSLWKTRKNTVPGEGNADAKILFLGEAPGSMEDKAGRPFCGPAGKFLDELFKKNKIDRKKIFITSVLKCRPVVGNRNRPPKTAELKDCKMWWRKQIEIIKPEVIIILGRIAYDAVIVEKTFQETQGKFLTKNNQKYFITYHPAAGMRFPKIRKILERDFKKIKT